MREIEYDERMLEDYYINKFLNMIAIEYDGGLAGQFKKYYLKKCDEITRLENIIKEVREKIENTTINCEGKAEDLLDDIYEILDKENNNEIK